MSFDIATRNLAEKFSRDWVVSEDDSRQAMVNELAQRIQDTIEEYEQEKGL